MCSLNRFWNLTLHSDPAPGTRRKQRQSRFLPASPQQPAQPARRTPPPAASGSPGHGPAVEVSLRACLTLTGLPSFRRWSSGSSVHESLAAAALRRRRAHHRPEPGGDGCGDGSGRTRRPELAGLPAPDPGRPQRRPGLPPDWLPLILTDIRAPGPLRANYARDGPLGRAGERRARFRSERRGTASEKGDGRGPRPKPTSSRMPPNSTRTRAELEEKGNHLWAPLKLSEFARIRPPPPGRKVVVVQSSSLNGQALGGSRLEAALRGRGRPAPARRSQFGRSGGAPPAGSRLVLCQALTMYKHTAGTHGTRPLRTPAPIWAFDGDWAPGGCTGQGIKPNQTPRPLLLIFAMRACNQEMFNWSTLVLLCWLSVLISFYIETNIYTTPFLFRGQHADYKRNGFILVLKGLDKFSKTSEDAKEQYCKHKRYKRNSILLKA